MHSNKPNNVAASAGPRRTPGGAIDTDYYLRQARDRRADFLQAIFSCIVRNGRRAWTCIKAKMEERAVQRQLASLSERELKDLALTRADVDALASGAYFTDPTRSPRSRERLRKCA